MKIFKKGNKKKKENEKVNEELVYHYCVLCGQSIQVPATNMQSAICPMCEGTGFIKGTNEK